MGSRIELGDGLSVTGVRAGLGRITANPSGWLGVARESWLPLRTDTGRAAAKSRALEAVPVTVDISPVWAAEIAVIGEEGICGV